MLIERRLLEHIGPGSAGVGSQHGSHATVWSYANGSVDVVGSLSVLLYGFIVSGDCASVMNGTPTFTRPFSRLPARSSVGDTLRGFVRRSWSNRSGDRLATLLLQLRPAPRVR